MKKIFNIEVKETIKDTFEIEADNLKEAEYLAEKGYYDAKYVLDNVNAEYRKLSFADINSPHYMSDDRMREIFSELLDYVYEHTENQKDYYQTLKYIIGLEENEITELGIDVERILDAESPIEQNEINLEDDIMVMDEFIRACVSLDYIDVFKKFDIEMKNENEYNLFLDYDTKNKTCKLIIAEKWDDMNITYEYVSNDSENKMLIKKLEDYCKSTINMSLEELMEEVDLEFADQEY